MKYKIDAKEPAIGTLLMLISYATVSAVLFAPGIPEMRDYFAVSASKMQLVVTVFLFFYALSQLIFGPLANTLGRKKTIYLGVGIGVIGSVICALSGVIHSYLLLVIGRCIAALGSGAGLVLTFTIINDFYHPHQALKITAWASIAFAAAPGLSATLGGLLVTHFGWGSCFWLLAVYGIIIILFSARLPETSMFKAKMRAREIARKYQLALAGYELVYFAAIIGGTTAILYIFASVGPLIVVNYLKIRADIYGMLNLILTCGLLLGNIIVLNMRKVNTLKMIKLGLWVMAVGVIIYWLLFIIGIINVYSIFLPGFIVFLGIALLYSSAATLAMSNAQDKASASAIMSFVNVGFGCAGTIVAAVLPFESETNLPVCLLLIILILAVVLFYGNQKSS